MSLRTWLLGAAGLLVACVPSIEKPKNTAGVGSTLALFEPDAADPCASVLPYPSDLAKSPTTGKLDIPYCPTDDATTIGLKTGLRTLDGWSLNGPIYTKFSGALDQASLTAAGPGGLPSVMLARVDVSNPEAPTGALVAIEPVFDASSNTLYLNLPAGTHLAERTMYVAIVTTGVTDTAGKPVMSDQVFTFMKSTTPLIDARGHSTTGALSDDQANGVEQLRQGWAPLFGALEATIGLQRKDVAVAWPFTTQTVHASLPALAALVTATAPTITVESATPASLHPLVQAAGAGTQYGCVYAGRIAINDLLTSTGTFGVGSDGNPVVAQQEVKYLLLTPPGVGGAACTTAWAQGDTNVAVYAHGLGRCKNDAILAGVGLATSPGKWSILALDGPRSGDRMVEKLGQSAADLCPTQPATPEFIMLPGESSPNPFVIRDELREWGLELVQAATQAATDPWKLAGLTKPAGATTAVSAFGHSWGGMAAVLARSVAAETITKVATNISSAELGSVFAPLLTAALGETAAPQAIATFRWVLEPGDPLYAAEAFPKTDGKVTGALAQVVSAGSATSVTDAPLHATATQELLAGKLDQPMASVVYTMSSGSTAFCDSSTSLVGELLRPCKAAALEPAPDPNDPSVQLWGLMHKQLATFLATGAVCNPFPPSATCP